MNSRIVFIPQTPEFGGAEIHLIQLIRALRRPHDCIIWYYPTDFYSEHLTDQAGVRVLARQDRVTRRSVLKFWWDLVRLHPRTVVFVKGIADAHPWYAYLAARLSGARCVIAIEQLIADPPLPPANGPGISGWLRKKFGWRARYLVLKRLEGHLTHVTICVSKAVRHRLVHEYGYPADKTTTIYNGIDIDRLASGDGKPSLPGLSFARGGECRQILCVARLSPVKRLDLLLEALHRVRAPVPWRCTVVGGGSLEAELRSQAERLELSSRIEFTGQVTNVRPYLERADVFVLPSEKEGFSLALLEAMMFGLPAIVTDVGGNREIVIHGKTGLLVNPGDAVELAQAIQLLLVNDEARRQMGLEASRHVRAHFDAEKSWEQYRELLLR